MNDERKPLLAMLIAADDPVYAEMPGGYQHESFTNRVARFNAFVEALNVTLAAQCHAETWPRVQDASFVGSVNVPPQLLLKDEIAQVRVSHFGDFATLCAWDGAVAPEALAVIESTARASGYVWAPAEVLDLPYTGANPGVDGFRSWRERYFDCI